MTLISAYIELFFRGECPGGKCLDTETHESDFLKGVVGSP